MLRNGTKHPVKGLGWGARVTLVRARVGKFSATHKKQAIKKPHAGLWSGSGNYGLAGLLFNIWLDDILNQRVGHF